MRSRLHAGLDRLDRRSISNLVHWCRGVYLIYYCGAKQLVLSIPDEANRTAVLQNLDSSGQIEVQGRKYEMLSEGPLSHLPRAQPAEPRSGDRGDRTDEASEAEASECLGRASTPSRGAAWVREAVQQESSSRSRLSRLFEALKAIHLPADVTLQCVGDVQDASDDSIRAVNLSNRISPEDLPSAVQAGMRKIARAARLPGGNLPPSVQLEHYLGGPCAPSQCHVFLPVGGPDGVIPPLPSGFNLLGDLNIAVGTDLAAAFHALSGVRGWSTDTVNRQDDEPPRKVPRVGQQGELAQDLAHVDDAGDGGCMGHIPHAEDTDAENTLAEEDEEQSDDGSDFWGRNAGELAATPPPDDSSEDDDDQDAVLAFDTAETVAGIAAEHILRRVSEHAAQNQPESAQQESEESAAAMRPLKVFWGEARWQRTQLLGELARGDWGLCRAKAGDLLQSGLWPQLIQDQRPVVAPRSEMTRSQTADAMELELHLRRARREPSGA